MNRTINTAGLSLIMHFEGFRQNAYRCPAGVWTIGYGHTGGVTPGQSVSPAQAEELLRNDLADAEAAVARLVRVPLNENQFAALVSFAFNSGAGSLRNSTLLHRLNQGDYAAVPAELRRWVNVRDRKTGQLIPLPGLVRRRNAEAELWLATP